MGAINYGIVGTIFKIKLKLNYIKYQLNNDVEIFAPWVKLHPSGPESGLP